MFGQGRKPIHKYISPDRDSNIIYYTFHTAYIYPIPSMGLVYLPTCTIRISQMMPNVGKYTSPMDGMGVSSFYNKYLGFVFCGHFVRIGIPGDSSPYRFFPSIWSKSKTFPGFFLAETKAFSPRFGRLGLRWLWGWRVSWWKFRGPRGLGGWWSTYKQASHECLGPQKGSWCFGKSPKISGKPVDGWNIVIIWPDMLNCFSWSASKNTDY